MEKSYFELQADLSAMLEIGLAQLCDLMFLAQITNTHCGKSIREQLHNIIPAFHLDHFTHMHIQK